MMVKKIYVFTSKLISETEYNKQHIMRLWAAQVFLGSYYEVLFLSKRIPNLRLITFFFYQPIFLVQFWVGSSCKPKRILQGILQGITLEGCI